jgi:uncharacterized protein
VSFTSHLPGLARFALALAVGLAGGVVFHMLGLPLPYMLGAMAACMVAALSGLPVETPKPVRGPMAAVIGAMIGTSFTAGALAGIGTWLATVAALVLFLVVSGLICTILIIRLFGYDLRTAFFSGMPGGLTDMVILGDQYGGDIRRIALIHSTRVFLIVFTLPVVIGLTAGAGESVGAVAGPRLHEVGWSFYFWFTLTVVLGVGLGRLIRLPAPFILGPMMVSAVVHMAGWSDYQLPVELVIVAQVTIGASVGVRFRGAALREILGIAGVGAVSTVVLMLITLMFAWVTGLVTDHDPIAVLLAFSPGGFAEMGLVALSLGIDTAFVAAHHAIRVAMVSFGAATIFRLWKGPPTPAAPTPPPGGTG